MKDNVTKLPPPVNPRDPLDVNQRLYGQISKLLDQLDDRDSRETVTMRERIAALVAIGRIQVIFMGLRKEQDSDHSTGSSVRKYATAFTAHDARQRKKSSRHITASAPDDDSLEAIVSDDGDDAT